MRFDNTFKFTDEQILDIEVLYVTIIGRDKLSREQFRSLLEGHFEEIQHLIKLPWFDPEDSDIVGALKKELLRLNNSQIRIKSGKWAENLLVQKYKWEDRKKNPTGY